MIGLELKPEAGGARQYCERLKENGLLCKETHNDIIRFAPPLVITKEQVEWAVEKIGEVITT
jgi:ornithine--oxo-acid transaminase